MLEEEIIKGCLKFDVVARTELYQQYFNMAMHICIRYSKTPEEAKTILLDSFKNIFNGFKNYVDLNSKVKVNESAISLQDWIKKETILAAIEHMHTNKKEYFVSSTVNTRLSEKQAHQEMTDEEITKTAGKKNIIKALQQLTPSYRVIFNLHEIDGYSHLEISKLLDISEYTSKDSLAKAKFNLRKNITEPLAH